MTVCACSDKERFYIENLLKLLFEDDFLGDTKAEGKLEETDGRICYNVSIFHNDTKQIGHATADEKIHFGHQKALLAAIGNAVFDAARSFSHKDTPYGILTGVRPVKVALYYLEAGLTEPQTERLLISEYRIRNDKARLMCKLAKKEVLSSKQIDTDDFMLYVSIPFCPSRCRYCSFISQAAPKETAQIPEYVNFLIKELSLIAKICNSKGKHLRAVYFGGGTPSILSAEQLNIIIENIYKLFPLNRLNEFTVECGRPDTIDRDKLTVLHEAGVGRISINPQTTNDEVLKRIGRNHTVKQFFEAFSLAREIGFPVINTDLIAGLDGDSLESFVKSMDDIISLQPENITVHSLYRKRASDSTMSGEQIQRDTESVEKMIDYSYSNCINSGLSPYYLYRQKGTVGNLENLGYSKPGTECLYNIGMMEDIATVISCGAGAVTKIYSPKVRDRIVNTDEGYQPIKRFSFYKYPTEYIKYFDSINDMYAKISQSLQ